MPTYTYRAKDQQFQLVQGTIEAESESAAISRLGSAGVYPIAIAEAIPRGTLRRRGLRRRVPERPLAYMTRQLADLLSGGLSLANALALVSQQTEHRWLRGVVTDVGAAVRDGQTFSDVLSRYPEVFSPLYVSLVKSGETGGALDAVLVRIADLSEKEVEIKSRVALALFYPLTIFLLGLCAVIFLIVYMFPKVAGIFAEAGHLLPLPTRIIMSVSHGLTEWWWAWLITLAGVIWAGRMLYRSNAGRAALDGLVLRLPLCSQLVRKSQTARLTRSLGIMVGQGVPILQALQVSASTIGNTLLRRVAQEILSAVRDGSSLSEAFGRSGQFSAFVGNMVAVGEESGTVERALLKVAAVYEHDTDRTLQVLMTVLEPLILITVGAIVLFIVLAMLLPIFELSSMVQ